MFCAIFNFQTRSSQVLLFASHFMRFLRMTQGNIRGNRVCVTIRYTRRNSRQNFSYKIFRREFPLSIPVKFYF